MPRDLRRLLARVRPHARWIALAVALSLALSAGRYLRAWLVKPILDDVLLAGAPDAAGVDERFAFVVAVAVGLVAVLPLVQFARAVLVEWVLGRIHVDMERDVCSALLSLPLSAHQDRRRGDALARTLRDVGVAHSALALLFGEFVLSLAMIVVGAGTLLLISWQLALLVAVAGPLIFAVISLFGRRIRRSARRRQESWSDVTQRLVEILEGIKVIKAFRAEALEDDAFRGATERLFRRSMKVVRQRVLARSAVEMLNSGVALGVLLAGTWLVWQGRFELSAGALAAFAAALATTYKPVKVLAKGWVHLADAEPSAARFFEVLDAPPEVRDEPGALDLPGVSRGVRLRDVWFSYGGAPVLRGVDLELRAGEVVALVGPTGAGKTTLADLLLRFREPDAGSIEIDGVDVRRIRRDALLARTALVAQDPFLFDGSIRDNIRYGRPGAGDAEILAAARAAHVDEFATRLPRGYDTEVGAGGVRLSGGQRQRVAIARALLRDPDLLVFDEATSALDARSERAVQDATQALLAGRTVLVIAHRLSTIRRADRIALLEDGRITHVGSHAELARTAGPYRELMGLPGEAAAAAVR